MKFKKYFYLFTLAYFALGFVNILFAWLGLVCMTLPLLFLFRDTKKTWCQNYCPRASLYSTCGKLTAKHSHKTPSYFIKGNLKWIMLIYFSISLTLIILTTIMVAIGKKPPMNHLRFLIVFNIPFKIPQLISIEGFQNWIYHFGYRMYSMMLTTTVLGLILAFIFKPRTWCTICPIATVSDVYIKAKKKIKLPS